MDIAKIRKKAKEKEKEAEERESTVRKSPEPGVEAIPEQTVPEISVEPPPEAAPGSREQREEATSPPEQGLPEDVSEEKKEETGEAEEDEMVEILTFGLAKEEFAFRVPEVEEIVRYLRTTKVPAMPAYVHGITSLRGKIIPVIDLKTKLGLQEPDGGGQERTVTDGQSGRQEKILILAGPKGPIGALIDRVIEVVRLPKSKVLEPPAHLNKDEVKFIEGVVIYDKRFISIIRSEDALSIDIS
jgi:purine-binding chemotaxis protein CheW